MELGVRAWVAGMVAVPVKGRAAISEGTARSVLEASRVAGARGIINS